MKSTVIHWASERFTLLDMTACICVGALMRGMTFWMAFIVSFGTIATTTFLSRRLRYWARGL